MPHSCAKSTRDSWMKSHHPDSLRNSGASPHRMGNLVIDSAPSMFTIIGIAASRVSNPMTMSTPQPISKTPSRVAKNAGAGIPAFSNRPVPSDSGRRNFKIPSQTKTTPTYSRIRTTAAGARVDASRPSHSVPEPTDLPFLNRNPTVDWAPQQPPAWYAASTRHEPGGHTGITGRPTIRRYPISETDRCAEPGESPCSIDALAPAGHIKLRRARGGSATVRSDRQRGVPQSCRPTRARRRPAASRQGRTGAAPLRL